MKVNEQTVISMDNYKELEKMLTAEDQASSDLALTILEQSDYEESKVFLILLIKDCFQQVFGTVSDFETKTPTLAEKVKKELVKHSESDITKMSFKVIYDLAVTRGIQEETEFVLSILRDQLKCLLSDFDYEFVNYTDILIKPTGWEDAIKKELEEAKAEIKLIKENNG